MEAKEDGHAKIDMGAMLPQTRGHQEPSEAGRDKEGPSPRACRESVALLAP